MGRPNRFHKARHDWVRRWIGEPLPASPSHLVIELYPWHSINVPRPFRPDTAAVRRYVWEPLSELGPFRYLRSGLALCSTSYQRSQGSRFSLGFLVPGKALRSTALAPQRER